MKLGITVRDRITGFTGVVTGFCTYITGCNQVLVSPPVDEKGAHVAQLWIDEQRLERVGTDIVELDNSKTSGFDMPAPIR